MPHRARAQISFAELEQWYASPFRQETGEISIVCQGTETLWPSLVFFLKHRLVIFLQPSPKRTIEEIYAFFSYLPYWLYGRLVVDFSAWSPAAREEMQKRLAPAFPWFDLRDHGDVVLPEPAPPLPCLSLIIPTMGEVNKVLELVRSVRAQKQAPTWEALVVCNPRNRQILHALKDFPQVRVLDSEPRGVNRARNRGIAEARFEWLYFLDDDCMLNDPLHLQKAARILARASSQTIFGGPYELKLPAPPSSQVYHAWQSRWIEDGWHPQFGWKNLLGGNLFVHRDLLSTIRFDDQITFGGAETDFLARAMRAGARGQFLPHLAVKHAHALTTLELGYKSFCQGFAFERRQSQEIGIPTFPQSLAFADVLAQYAPIAALYSSCFDRGRAAFRSSELVPPRKRILAEVREQLSPVNPHAFPKLESAAHYWRKWSAAIRLRAASGPRASPRPEGPS